MKIKDLLIICILTILLIMFCNIKVYAIDTSSVKISTTGMKQFDDIGSIIISTIRYVGMFISVIALMVIGIRYMLSSVEERATEKQSMIFYCIGSLLLFSIVNIVSVIYEMVSKW